MDAISGIIYTFYVENHLKLAVSNKNDNINEKRKKIYTIMCIEVSENRQLPLAIWSF